MAEGPDDRQRRMYFYEFVVHEVRTLLNNDRITLETILSMTPERALSSVVFSHLTKNHIEVFTEESKLWIIIDQIHDKRWHQ